MSYADRFKPTALANMQERKQEVAVAANLYDNEEGTGLKRMTISKDGVYKIRMYPPHPHPSNKQTSIEPKAFRWLPGYVNKKDSDGKWIQKPGGGYEKELGMRPVLNSKVHGGAPYDLADTYCDIIKRYADEKFPNPADIDQKKKYLLPLVGSFQSEHKGINLIRTFLFYGDLLGANGEAEFNEFEVKPSVEKGLNRIAAVEAEDEPLATDGVFTDPVEGRPFKIKVDSVAGKADPGNYYSVNIVNDTEQIVVDGRKMNALKSYPISEEKLQWFDEKIPPLINYRTCFNHRDLQFQLEGLRLFDEKHGYGAIEDPEFLNVYAALDKLFPVPAEDGSNAEVDSVTSPTSNKSQDKFDLMDHKELKEYIQINKLGIRVLPRYTEEDLREMIREVENETDEVEERDEVANVPAADEVVEEKRQDDGVVEATAPTTSLSDRLAKLKAGLGK